MYVYIFEDGEIAQDKRGPTAEDLLCIEYGILYVLYVPDGDDEVYELDKDGERSLLRKTPIRRPGGGNQCHVPPE